MPFLIIWFWNMPFPLKKPDPRILIPIRIRFQLRWNLWVTPNPNLTSKKAGNLPPLNLRSEADFLRIYSKSSWYVDGQLMRILKWNPNFHVNRESSRVPVWICLPRLPLQLFNKEVYYDVIDRNTSKS